MNERKPFLRFFTIPIFLFILVVTPACYCAWKEHSISNDLINLALNGNSIAIQILLKYEKPWKLDKKVVRAALDQNEYAIKILGLSPAKS